MLIKSHYQLPEALVNIKWILLSYYWTAVRSHVALVGMKEQVLGLRLRQQHAYIYDNAIVSAFWLLIGNNTSHFIKFVKADIL